MATETTPTDQRRFTSVILSHRDLTDLADLARLIGKGGSNPVTESREGPWSFWRWEYMAPQNLYPERHVNMTERSRPEGWAHDLYMGSFQSGDTSYMLLASPYTRLLRRIVDELTRGLRERPALQFVTIDMEHVFRAFQAGVPGMTATKVTMQMLDEPTVELVSLTGRNPLNSKLHSQIKAVARPYAIRSEVAVGDGKTRVNIDRHGNLWWYQTDESKTRLVFAFLEILRGIGAMKLSRRMPLDSASDDEQE